jgi:hypothetical protein
MKLSYAQIAQAAPVIGKMIDVPLNATVAIPFADLIDALNPHLRAMDDYKNTLAETESDAMEANKKFAEFMMTVADVNITPISPHLIGSSLQFTIREMAAIRFAFSSSVKEEPQVLFG